MVLKYKLNEQVHALIITVHALTSLGGPTLFLYIYICFQNSYFNLFSILLLKEGPRDQDEDEEHKGGDLSLLIKFKYLKALRISILRLNCQ